MITAFFFKIPHSIPPLPTHRLSSVLFSLHLMFTYPLTHTRKLTEQFAEILHELNDNISQSLLFFFGVILQCELSIFWGGENENLRVSESGSMQSFPFSLQPLSWGLQLRPLLLCGWGSFKTICAGCSDVHGVGKEESGGWQMRAINIIYNDEHHRATLRIWRCKI